MPRMGITAYDLLISCPGDVNEYVEVAKNCIEQFNRTLGKINNAQIVAVHWSTDSFSQSGDRPQELLNNQIVRNCDAAVAIFWTKFGTSTEKFGSGTEEEIEEMLGANKQVFMYFVDEPVPPSKLNNEQYTKIIEFRNKYKDKGIYFVVKDKKEFERQFTNDLTMYFLLHISGTHKDLKKKPNLSVIDYKTKTTDVCPIAFSLCNSDFMKEQEDEIKSIMDKLSKDILPNNPEEEESAEEENVEGKNEKEEILKEEDEEGKNVEGKNIVIIDSQTKTIDMGFLKKSEKVEIEEIIKKTISEYANRMNIDIPLGFWNLGSLTKSYSYLPSILGGGSFSYIGKDEERKRLEAIEDLYFKINELNQYNDYFRELDHFIFLDLVLTNTGTDVDEDIDVKLRLEKGKIVKKSDIPLPGTDIIESILETQFIEDILKEEETDSISSYTEYPILPERISLPQNILGQTSTEEEYEEYKAKYRDIINQVCCYQLFEDEDEDVIKVHFSYLKHHTSIAFPSTLLFTSVPNKIEYEITSKHTADVVKGTLEIVS